jgi:FkbM family methyltransferase
LTHHPVFAAFAPQPVTASGLHLYDFLGSATRAAFKRGWAGHAQPAGRKMTPALPPANEHYLDWIALLTAVGRARGTFRMAELGAGWAPWLVRAALACRQRPEVTSLELMAVEADPTHFAWIGAHFRDNGLNPAAHMIRQGAISARPGVLEFPVIAEPDVDYGASLAQAAAAPATIRVPAIGLNQVLEGFTGPLDFLHIDIQGAEYDAIPPAMELMQARVRSVMVGTHQSDAAHDGLAARFRAAGWTEVMAHPRKAALTTPWGAITLGDGFLWYDNPALSGSGR